MASAGGDQAALLRPLRILVQAPDAARDAAAVLIGGGLAALPTETVYGLAALAADAAAVGRVFAAKGRPRHNPLIVHCASAAMAARLGEVAGAADALAEAFWPGPLTLVVALRQGAPVAEAALGGGTTVALRVPQVTFFRDVVGRTGPLVAPSANRSGRVSATSAEAVMEELHGLIDLVVDDGPSPIGVESTVIDVTGAPRLLRPGAIPLGTIEAVVGPVSLAERAGPLRSPGLLHSHYAPRALLRLDVPAKDVRADEGWLAFGEDGAQAAHIVRLSPSGDLDEAARGLYAGLRALDATGVGVIAVSPIPNEGVGVAIRDRLMRAAAPREGDG